MRLFKQYPSHMRSQKKFKLLISGELGGYEECGGFFTFLCPCQFF